MGRILTTTFYIGLVTHRMAGLGLLGEIDAEHVARNGSLWAENVSAQGINQGLSEYAAGVLTAIR
jgi:hypothetical protein